MRSSTILSALFAASALSSPLHHKRVEVIDEVVVTVTDYVTEGAAAPAATSVVAQNAVPSAPLSTTAVASSAAPVSVAPASASTPLPAPSSAPAASSSPVAAPAPASSSPAPAPAPASSSSPAPAPASSAAPSSAAPAATSDSTSALPTTFPASLDPGSTEYQDLAVLHHNIHRSNHTAGDVSWNATLAGYAKTMAQTCTWSENQAPGTGGYGTNIAAGNNASHIAAIVTGQWYDGEVEDYPQYGVDSPDMSNFENWGHMSQVVWAGTESIGCFSAYCIPDGVEYNAFSPNCDASGNAYLKNQPCDIPPTFTVCNYYPEGNMIGSFTQVHAPKGQANVGVTSDGISGL